MIENDVYAGENYLPPIKDLLSSINLSLILNDSTLAYITEKTINPISVKRLKEIGHGHFGKVYKGKSILHSWLLIQCHVSLRHFIVKILNLYIKSVLEELHS